MRFGFPLLALAACFDGPRGACTLVYCTSEATITLVPFTDPAPYLGAAVTLCVNERCASAPLPTMPPADGTGTMETASGALSMFVTFERRSGYYQLRIQTNGDDFEHGDEYSLEIRGTDGDVVVQHAWTADYVEYEPNGPRCGPLCLQETIEIPGR